MDTITRKEHSTAAIDAPLHISTVTGARDNRPQDKPVTWCEFLMLLVEPDERGDMSLAEYQRLLRQAAEAGDATGCKRIKQLWKKSKDGAAIVPGRFDGKGRKDENMLAVYVFAGDIDNGNVTRQDIETRLSGYTYACHSSYSHCPEVPRWRFYVLLKEAIPHTRYGDVFERFNALFDGNLDAAGSNPSHVYYLPVVPPDDEHYTYFTGTGAPFELPQDDVAAGYSQSTARKPRFTQESGGANADTVEPLLAFIRDRNMLLDAAPNRDGFYWMQCPWRHEHTDGDEKARFALPTDSGGVGFHCFHSHCADRNINDLLAWAVAAGYKPPGADKPEKKSQATILVELCAGLTLFHDETDTAYATLAVNGHREHWPLRSPQFRRFLGRRFHAAHNKAPSTNAMQDALAVLEGQAFYDGELHTVYTRVAYHDGVVYLDLCADQWQVVEVTAEGWRVTQDPPVRFIRRNGMQPLPMPAAAGDIDELWRFLNVREQADRALVLAWLAQALFTPGPYPVLVVQGEHGTAKSTAGQLLRSLVDPSSAALRAKPRNEHDLAIWARNAHVIALDNLSGLPDWLSDGICRISTGAAFATRTLYTDTDETLIQVKRPVILNGIDDIATRPDLISRALILNLEPIPEEHRRHESDLWRDFEAARPRILGALLNAVSIGLLELPDTRPNKLPRMADFAIWATACERGLGLDAGEFLELYDGNQIDAIEAGLQGSALACALRDFMAGRTSYRNRVSTLLLDLVDVTDEETRKLPSWPKAPHHLSRHLKRLAPSFRAVGLDIQLKRNDGGQVCIEKTAPDAENQNK